MLATSVRPFHSSWFKQASEDVFSRGERALVHEMELAGGHSVSGVEPGVQFFVWWFFFFLFKVFYLFCLGKCEM